MSVVKIRQDQYFLVFCRQKPQILKNIVQNLIVPDRYNPGL